MRARPSAPNTPRSARSKSYKRGRGAFSFDNEHIAAAPSEPSSGGLPAHVSGDDEPMLSDTATKATRNWTPRKTSREYILSPLQNLTPTRLSHALGNIDIATTPSSRPRAGGQGRSSSFLTSPQSSFALSSATTSSATAYWKRRRCYYSVILVIFISVVVILGKQVPIEDTSPSVATKGTPGEDIESETAGKKTPLRGDQQLRGASDMTIDEQEEISAHGSSIIQLTDTNDEDSSDVRKRLEDGVEAISQSNLIDEENVGVTTLTETEVFNSMLQLAKRNKELCGERRLGQEQRQNSNQLEDLDFGIIGEIESYLNGTASQTVARPKCAHLPPPTSCGARNFTVLIDASLHSVGYGVDPRHRSSHHRTIFILALRMQSLPSASEIIIQYGGVAGDLEWDRKYGRRLLMWNDDSKVAVKVLFVEGQDQSIFDILSEIANEAVLYVSATLTRADLNGISAGGLELGFDIWKQHSDTLVAVSNGALVRRDHPMVLQELEASAFHEDCPIFNSSETSTDGKSGAQLPFFFHRNYRCLLDHEVFTSLRQVVSTPTFIRNIVGRVGTSPPILFPGLLHKMRSTSAQHNAIGKEEAIFYDKDGRTVDLDVRRLPEDADMFFGSVLNPVHWCNDASFCQTKGMNTVVTAEKIKLVKSRCTSWGGK